MEAIRDHFQWVNDTLRRWSACGSKPSRSIWTRFVKFAARAYRRPLSQAERDEMLAYYRSLREKSGLTHEEAMRDSIVSVLMSPNFCYRIDLRTPRSYGRAECTPPRDEIAGATRPAAVRLRARQPVELFPLVEHAGRGTPGARGGRRSAEAGRPDRAGAPDAEGRTRARPGHGVRRQLARLPAL